MPFLRHFFLLVFGKYIAGVLACGLDKSQQSPSQQIRRIKEKFGRVIILVGLFGNRIAHLFFGEGIRNDCTHDHVEQERSYDMMVEWGG